MQLASRCLLIGPVPPFRGGISQHTNALRLEMSKLADVRTVSFERLYPRGLYPGTSDRDESLSMIESDCCTYSLDSINPFSWLSVIREVEAFQPDIAVIPWWTFVLSPCFGYLSRALQRRDVHVRYLCHNVIDHEAAIWKRWAVHFALSGGTSFIAQSRAEAEMLYEICPRASVEVHPHPIYDFLPEPDRARQRSARTELLFFGFVRRYKGVDVLIDAMKMLTDHDVHLVIAGEVWPGAPNIAELIERAGLASRIRLVSHFIDDQETANLINDADAMVLPYLQVSGSGVLALAFNAGKPVVASRLGSFTELIDDGETGWLVEPGSAEELAGAIMRVADKAADMESKVLAKARTLTWTSLANLALKLG